MAETLPQEINTIGELRRYLEQRDPAFREAAEKQRAFEQMLAALREAMRATRKERQVRQSELAETMATTQSAISAIEKGSGDLGVLTLIRYLDGLGVEPALWLQENAHKLQVEAYERAAV